MFVCCASWWEGLLVLGGEDPRRGAVQVRHLQCLVIKWLPSPGHWPGAPGSGFCSYISPLQMYPFLLFCVGIFGRKTLCTVQAYILSGITMWASFFSCCYVQQDAFKYHLCCYMYVWYLPSFPAARHSLVSISHILTFPFLQGWILRLLQSPMHTSDGGQTLWTMFRRDLCRAFSELDMQA